MNAWNNSELNCFSDSGMESIRKFGASEISGQQFADGLWEDLLSVGLNVAAGAATGVEGGPWGMAAGDAYGGLRAGVQIGVKRFKSEALQQLQKLFESQPKYAYAGDSNSNFKDFTNFKKQANNAPRNAKGSGGSGSQGPSVKEAGRKGTDGYKLGKYWDKLKPVNKPEANRQIGKINKQAFGGGEMRTDGEKLYRFDNGHKNGKIHVEMYKKTSKGWQPYAECDPETGAILEGSLERMAEREPVRW